MVRQTLRVGQRTPAAHRGISWVSCTFMTAKYSGLCAAHHVRCVLPMQPRRCQGDTVAESNTVLSGLGAGNHFLQLLGHLQAVHLVLQALRVLHRGRKRLLRQLLAHAVRQERKVLCALQQASGSAECYAWRSIRALICQQT